MTQTATRPATQTAKDNPQPAEDAVLRIARASLRSEPPAVRFVPRDVRLPQL